MKIFTYILALELGLGLGLSTAQAEDSVVGENAAQTVGSSAIPGEANAADVFLNAGLGLAMLGGNTGWAFNLGALTEYSKNSNLFVGADLGLNLWNFNTAGVVGSRVPTSATGIQLLPTAIYRFQVAGAWYPYVGVSAGPYVRINNYELAGVSQSDTDLQLELLFRPGFFLNIGKTVSLQVEGKLGVLDAQFVFLPQANAVLAL